MGFFKVEIFFIFYQGFQFHSVGFRCMGWEKTKARKNKEEDLKRESELGEGGGGRRREEEKIIGCYSVIV